ncbi:hypothetical protein IJE86_04185 [bacterium]|nr:hypothetical protein [bacterium]
MSIGMNYSNWVANKQNYYNALAGKDTKFKYAELDGVPKKEQFATVQKALLELAKSRIEQFDANKNGATDFDEYLKEQSAQYEQMFGESVDIGSIPEMKNELKKIFDTLDLNKDGKIDAKETATLTAYTDGYDGDGKINGELSYVSMMQMAEAYKNPSFTGILKAWQNFLFPQK